MPAGSLRDPNQLALLLQLAMQEQAANPANGQSRVIGRPQSALALNAYVDAMPSAGEKDADFQRQRTADLQAQDEEQLARNKALLSDPSEKAKSDASVEGFQNRKEAQVRTVKGIKRITDSPMTTEGRQAAETVSDPTYGMRLKVQRDQAATDPRVITAQIGADAGIKAATIKASEDKLTKVEHKDPATGKTVIEWLPQSQLRGQTFDKGTNATTENRLNSAEAVNQTGNDMINKLSDPAYAAQVGVAMGRYNSLRDFVGNPPPEFAELAGTIESYSLANMGVHGMRSAQGAEQIKKLLDQKHTPESLIATIRGLNQFSNHFMENEGRKVPSSSGTTPAGGSDPYADYLARQKK